MTDNRTGDLESNITGLRDGIASGVEAAAGLAQQAQSTASQAADTIRQAAAETSRQASETAAKAYRQGAQAADYVSRNAAEQPWTALLIAAAIGYAIAYAIHGR